MDGSNITSVLQWKAANWQPSIAIIIKDANEQSTATEQGRRPQTTKVTLPNFQRPDQAHAQTPGRCLWPESYLQTWRAQRSAYLMGQSAYLYPAGRIGFRRILLYNAAWFY